MNVSMILNDLWNQMDKQEEVVFRQWAKETLFED